MNASQAHQRHSMPVGAFLEQFHPAYPNVDEGLPTWADAFDFFETNSNDNALIERLVAELERHGRFDVPVRVNYDDDLGCWFVSDGMHRTAAWVRSGVRFIEFAEWDDFKACLSEFWYETDFLLSHKDGTELSTEEEELFVDDLLARLSHKLPTGEWATVALVSSSNGTFGVTWDSSTSHPRLGEHFTSKVEDAVEEAGFKASSAVSSVHLDYSEGED